MISFKVHLVIQISESDPVNEEEKRLRAAQAAERRMQDQQSRGITNPGGAPLRKAHAELPGNADSNLRWQVS